MPTFRATLQLNGKTATGVEVPQSVVDELGSGKRPAVRMTVNGHTWPNTVAVMGGRNLIGISAENRKLAGVDAGDVIDVTLELDTSTREVEIPADVKAAFKKNKVAADGFAKLSYSNQRRWIMPIEDAKTDETRQRRIDKMIADLSAS
ncbi:MAG: YdeI/OmpD-associated family protein [Actinomycetes bacterium]